MCWKILSRQGWFRNGRNGHGRTASRSEYHSDLRRCDLLFSIARKLDVGHYSSRAQRKPRWLNDNAGSVLSAPVGCYIRKDAVEPAATQYNSCSASRTLRIASVPSKRDVIPLIVPIRHPLPNVACHIQRAVRTGAIWMHTKFKYSPRTSI
jgi:hypothetical protein